MIFITVLCFDKKRALKMKAFKITRLKGKRFSWVPGDLSVIAYPGDIWL